MGEMGNNGTQIGRQVKENVETEADFAVLPMLRGKRLVVVGADSSLIDYQHDQSHSWPNTSTSDGELDSEKLEKIEKRCVKKVMLVERTAYDTVIKCHHSYHTRCHTSYVTGKHVWSDDWTLIDQKLKLLL